MSESSDTLRGTALHTLHDGADVEDPWIACLLGCVSLARSVERGLRESRPRTDTPPADPSDPALAWLLGIVALSQGFREHVASVETTRAGSAPVDPAVRRGLLR